VVQPKELNPFDSPQSFYGAELRRLREKAGFSQEGLGERVFCSGAYVGQIESANRRPQLDLSQRMDSVLDTGGHLERLCRMVLKTTKHAEYFAHVNELMMQAEEIWEFAAQILPGLLQTEAYARALIRATCPLLPEKRVEERVHARIERAVLFDDPATPQFWAILHEATLRMLVCDRMGMQEQMLHIAKLVRSRRIMVQIIPFSVGAHPLVGSAVTLMSFEEAPSAVYVEGAHSGHLLDTPAMVSEYRRSYDCARAVALSPGASLALIESVAEEYRLNEHSTGPEQGPVA
jgi:transcriptional regulator with XRE-family HTH domain